ncbi:MAG: PH domain-containing protein [bacterium]|nr:PH domain-containing protein [bacterium]
MKSIFSIFSESHNYFTGKEPDEKVLMLIHRHPFYIIVQFFIFVFLFILPFIVGTVFTGFLSLNGLTGIFIFLYGIWCLVLWQVLFYSITMYVLDMWIVTDKRIIDSTQHGFFNRSVSELHLNRVQDISVEVEGFIQTLLKFGDLEIQTAGTENKFKFHQIPNPNEVKNQIMSHISDTVGHHGGKNGI